MERRYKVSREQMDSFLSFMEEHQKFANNSFLGSSGVATKAKCWEKITERMNALGVPRDTAGWQSFWKTLRSHARAENAKLNKYNNRTGNQVDEQVEMDEIYKKVILIMGKNHGIGLPLLPELGIKTSPRR